jgi:hypothetical protein
VPKTPNAQPARPVPPPRLATGIRLSAQNGLSPSLLFGGGAFLIVSHRAFSFGLDIQGGVSSAMEPVQVAETAGDLTACIHLRAPFACALARVGWMQAWTHGSVSDGSIFLAVGARVGADVEVSSHSFVGISSDLLVEPYGPRFSMGQTYRGVSEVFRSQTATIYSSVVGAALNLHVGFYVP